MIALDESLILPTVRGFAFPRAYRAMCFRMSYVPAAGISVGLPADCRIQLPRSGLGSAKV